MLDHDNGYHGLTTVDLVGAPVGEYNSSLTRVAPIFDRLFAVCPDGEAWLPALLRLGDRASGVSDLPSQPRLVSGHGPRWGKSEMALPAPRGLLEYLVQNITLEQVAKSGDTGNVRKWREALARRDAGAITQALQEIRAGHTLRRVWYLLEGDSRPDATLEMERHVLLVEGKRTERSCTSTTKWMSRRSQLLRHMDAASEYFCGKRILGLLLVEGAGGSDAIKPSAHWVAESRAQDGSEMLSSSLPHRSPSERSALAAGMLGVATWQGLCAQNGIPWPPIISNEINKM